MASESTLANHTRVRVITSGALGRIFCMSHRGKSLRYGVRLDSGERVYDLCVSKLALIVSAKLVS